MCKQFACGRTACSCQDRSTLPRRRSSTWCVCLAIGRSYSYKTCRLAPAVLIARAWRAASALVWIEDVLHVHMCYRIRPMSLAVGPIAGSCAASRVVRRRPRGRIPFGMRLATPRLVRRGSAPRSRTTASERCLHRGPRRRLASSWRGDRAPSPGELILHEPPRSCHLSEPRRGRCRSQM